MRYLYSVIRYVPDAARAEFVNVGIVAVVDSAEVDSKLPEHNASKITRDWSRAAAISEFTAEQLHGSIGYDLCVIMEMPETIPELFDAHESHHGVIQFSKPYPALGESAHSVIAKLWPIFIVEKLPTWQGRPIEKTQSVWTRLKDYLVPNIAK